MGAGFSKTLVCLIFILIGFLLQRKISNKDHLKGLKVVILSLALPATIFIALLKIDIEWSLLFLPIAALAINLILFASVGLFNRFHAIDSQSRKGRTLKMLIPSMAPGLSCFPFIIEYLGESPLAFAAFADVGNKFFGLILLYLLAMHWYYQRVTTYQSEASGQKSVKSKVKELLVTLAKEPINMVLVIGLGMLILGFNLASLPIFVQDIVQRLSLLMTPLVLLFIGLAVRVSKGEISEILSMLLWKSGIAFLLSGILIACLPGSLPSEWILLAVIFPQSAASFWPFAHMSAVHSLEKEAPKKTFDLKLATNILAFSLPLSTIIILTICSSQSAFQSSWTSLIAGLFMLGVMMVLRWQRRRSSATSVDTEELPQTKGALKKVPV